MVLVSSRGGDEAVPFAGHCAPRFEPLGEAFRRNLTELGELGAGLCVLVDGQVVAELWGGFEDAARTRPWRRDAMVNVFSVGKGLVALCAARLVGTGRLELGAPVARYWPEFAAAGKDRVTVAELLSHRAGLPAVRARLAPGTMFDHGAMAAALAAERPWWEPGTAHGYHVNTYGFLVGELVRRLEGRTVGDMVRDDLAAPLGADVAVGLPRELHARVAEFQWPGAGPPEVEPPGTEAELMAYNAYWNPSGLSGAGVVNTEAWRCAEIPSTNAHATAPGIARVYGALLGTEGGSRLVDPAVLAEFTTEHACGEDLVLRRPSRFGLGFQLTQPERPLGPNPRSFGHFGAGGSLGFCDPDAGVACGYVVNTMGPRWRNPRNRALLDALYSSLAGR